MRITALVSLEDATRNLSPNIYYVILHNSPLPQGFDKLEHLVIVVIRIMATQQQVCLTI